MHEIRLRYYQSFIEVDLIDQRPKSFFGKTFPEAGPLMHAQSVSIYIYISHVVEHALGTSVYLELFASPNENFCDLP